MGQLYFTMNSHGLENLTHLLLQFSDISALSLNFEQSEL